MELALYAHARDLLALPSHGGFTRLVDLGVREVAIAASYHAGRWLTPWSGQRVRFLVDGVVHFVPTGDYGALQPRPADDAAHAGLRQACEQARAAGIRTRAWVVGTHNTPLGERHPDVAVQNAFGDRYTYALCPAQPAVRQYLLALVRDVAAQPLDTIEFEAFGWMGFKHSSHHDKASFTPRGLLDYALSLCCCAACRAAFAAAGGDADAIAGWARATVDEHVRDGDAMGEGKGAAAAELPDVVQPAVEARRAVIEALAGELQQAAGDRARAVQVHPDPLFTGSQLPLPQAAAFPAADQRVLTVYGEAPDAIAQQLQRPGIAALSHKRLSLWPKAPQFRSDDDLRRTRDLAAERGFGSIAIYHLGLLPWRTIERAARVLSA